MSEQLARQIVKAGANPGTGLDLAGCEILSFDPATFENRIRYYSTVVENAPVLSGPEALTYQPGDSVACLKLFPAEGRRTTGMGQIAILGRIVRPGEANAERAISFMRQALAQQLAKDIIAATMLTATVFGIGERDNTAYGDLSFVDAGPVVPNVVVSATGKAVVALSCSMTAHINAGRQGFMSVGVTGASERDPDDNSAFVVGVGGDPTLAVDPTGQASEIVVIEGLSPGEHTFTAQYRTLTTGGPVTFTNPTMIVWTF